MDKDNPYDSYRLMREFIESLSSLNGIEGTKKKEYVPIKDIDAELINNLLNDWLKNMFNAPIDPAKEEFVVRVFKELKETGILEEWVPYISAMVEWLRLSSRNPMTANLAIFLLGYVWRKQTEDNESS